MVSGIVAAIDSYALALSPASPLVQPPPTPLGGQPAHSSGSKFFCAWWTLTLPANAVPNNSTVQCGAYNLNTAPAAPASYTLLNRTVQVNVYDNLSAWITKFNPSLTLCYSYTETDLARAADAQNFVILTAPVNGKWVPLPTSVELPTRKVCTLTDRLSLVDLAIKTKGTPPTAAPAIATPAPIAPAPAAVSIPNPSAAPARRVAALEYHHSSFTLNSNTMMTTHWFESQMKWLRDNDFYALNVDEFASYLAGSTNLPEKSVLLTFDLGTAHFDDFTNVIVPTLRKYNLKGIIFLVVNITSDQCANGYACWSRLREWQTEGILSVQSHGMTHPNYAKSSAQQIQKDAEQSKKVIEARLGAPVVAFAYPYDSAPAAAQSIVKALGYKFAMSGNTRSERSITPNDSHPFNLPRYYPYSGLGTYPVIYGTTLTFEQMMSGAVR
jgi:peptidoglycan/xylan/chitin deacetylase (PgdA/CDA1 family)